jgi:uncharacterized protein
MLIDCDVHHALRHNEQWAEYLAEPYRTEVARYGLRRVGYGVRYEDGGNRWDVLPENGRHPDEDPALLARLLLDRYGHRYALLTGMKGPVAGVPDCDYAAAICRAFNDYTAKVWLAHDPRYVAALFVGLLDPQLAVREIERWAGHPQVKAVCFYGATQIPFGQRFYWPIYAACERHGLPVHLHPATTALSANPATTGAGMASTYLEAHVCVAQNFQGHLVSLVLEGVFEKFPGLRFAFVEGGFGWLPHVLARMDKEFKGLRHQAPHLKRLPSEYVRENVRFTTQPMEEPAGRGLDLLLELLDAPHLLMYASDYPHFDFDEPSVVPESLGETGRRKVLHDNAAAFFGLR